MLIVKTTEGDLLYPYIILSKYKYRRRSERWGWGGALGFDVISSDILELGRCCHIGCPLT